MPDVLIDSTVPIAVEDLDILRAALSSAYHHCTVLDLAEQYRKLSVRPQASKLTQSLQNAVLLASSYLDLAQGPDDEPD